jgi:hypothetical protein
MAPLSTDALRALMIDAGEPEKALADELSKNGDVWDTNALQDDFTVEGFCAPFVVVRRKADDTRGTLMFTHHPRLYFAFSAA